jgi:uncharacterized protein
MVMLKRIAAPLVLGVALAWAVPVLAADATVDQVYQAAREGHLAEAQQLMDQVLKDHPNSAKAHYVEAEISAKARNFGRAREELATAQRLDPSGGFAKPESLAALQRELAGGSYRGPTGYYSGPTGYYTTAPRVEHHSFPWGIILLVVAGVVIAWALLARRNPPPTYGGGYGGVPGGPAPGGGYGVPPGYGPAGYGPGYGPPVGGGMGSGIVGGLASGLAIGAGVAAGEELVHHLVDRDGNRIPAPPDYVPPPDQNGNMGGNDFGVSDNSNWDDSSGDSGGGGGCGDDWT